MRRSSDPQSYPQDVECAPRGYWSATAAGGSARLLLDPVRELGDLVVDAPPFGHELTDLPVRVHDRGVVAVAELLPDLGQRQLGELAAQVHRDLPGVDEHPGPRRALQVVDRQAEV